jgi:2-oxoglutarate dehydrogenase E2 component (dihydrolipoamide succinyltransferase)
MRSEFDEGDEMPTDVIMPQMGESIAEGTVLRWMKGVGDRVERDEPLFEISTDKVDAEIPSPVSGVLAEIRVGPNTTVPINTVVGIIAAEGEAVASAPAADSKGEVAPVAPPAPLPEPASPPSTPPPLEAAPPAEGSSEERIRAKSSPLVRAIAAAEGIEIGEVAGSGIHGRVTKDDILGFLEQRKSAAAVPSPKPALPGAIAPAATPAARSISGGGFLLSANSLRPTEPAPLPPAHGANEKFSIEPLSVIRKRIAENMILSRRLNAHVTTFFEFDFGRIDALRTKHRVRFEQQNGVKLTWLPFVIKACASALRAFPVVNSLMDGDELVVKHDVNIGIAVALDWGLIVPVIRNVDQLSIAGVAHAATDLAGRARSRSLKLDDLSGGTFSITNPGVYGGLVGAPIIPVGQSAILGFGGIEKRPVVVTGPDGQDAIAIRPRAYMSLSFDHRLIDGAVADQFMAHVKKTVETSEWPELG